MQLLGKNNYGQVLEPLSHVTVNHLFARFVAEKQVEGRIYTDDPCKPATFYVVHPYGMSLLFGHAENKEFNLQLKEYMLNSAKRREKAEWLQAFPAVWNQKIEELLGDRLVHPDVSENSEGKVELNTRANFRFNLQLYEKFRQSLEICEYPVVRTDEKLFGLMQGAVVPRHFWNNADDFAGKGVGFSMVIDEKPVCTAYAAYIFEGQLELGIETCPEHRGKGFAIHTCASLIDYCIENKYEPIWSCRYENIASFKLAQKLGFEPTVTLPYYRLPV